MPRDNELIQHLDVPKYRKKPVVIEAMQYGPHTEPSVGLLAFLGDRLGAVDADGLIIPTLEGDMRASVGDWIIKGVRGEFYPCKPDIFAATYEPAVDALPTVAPAPAPFVPLALPEVVRALTAAAAALGYDLHILRDGQIGGEG